MTIIWALIRRNIKTLFSQKTTSLMIILGPLLITFMAGLAFDDAGYNLKIGVFSETSSPLAVSLVKSLSTDSFSIVNYRTVGSCIEALKKAETNLCLHIVQEPQSEAIATTFYVDYSRLSLAWQILSIVDAQISLKSAELGINFTTQVLNSIELTKNELEKNKETLIVLTTQNDDISKKINALLNILKSTNLDVNLTSLDNFTSSLESNKFLFAVTKMNEYSAELSQEYREVTDELTKQIEQSAISEQDKLKLIDIISKGRANVRALNDKTRIMTDISYQDLTTLQNDIAILSVEIDKIREEYYTLYGFKMSGIANLERIISALDKNLISVLTLQRALNKINSGYNELKISDPESALNPIKTTIKPVVAQKSGMHYVLPILLVLMIMFTGMLIAPVLISAERNSPAAIRNKLTPVSQKIFVLAAALSCFLIVGAQMLFVAILSAFFLGPNILLGFPFSLLAAALSIIFFVFLGMIFGYILKSEGLALLGSTLMAVFLVIFSDVVLPVETMPKILEQILRFNPVVVSIILLKKTLLFDLPLPDLGFDITAMLVLCLAAGIVAFIAGNAFTFRLGKPNKSGAKNNKQNA